MKSKKYTPIEDIMFSEDKILMKKGKNYILIRKHGDQHWFTGEENIDNEHKPYYMTRDVSKLKEVD